MHKWIKLVRPFSCLLCFPISAFSSSILTQDELKKIAAYKVVESGMIFGLCSGSTVKHAVDRLGELLQPGKVHSIIGISENTHQQVISLRIPLSNLDDYLILDLAIDGADEVDPHLNLVKVRCSLDNLDDSLKGKVLELKEELDSEFVSVLKSLGLDVEIRSKESIEQTLPSEVKAKIEVKARFFSAGFKNMNESTLL